MLSTNSILWFYYLWVVGTDVKLAGDVNEPLLGRIKVRVADTPWAINNVHQVIYSCAAAYTHTHKDKYLKNTN